MRSCTCCEEHCCDDETDPLGERGEERRVVQVSASHCSVAMCSVVQCGTVKCRSVRYSVVRYDVTSVV